LGRRCILKSIEDYSRALKSGRGLGSGAEYCPWIRVHDASSHGKSSKIQGIKTDRAHQLLSGIEENFFYYAEFNPRVIDIREQFPLFPLDLVVRISREANIDYPIDKDSKDPCVLSTDFLLTLDDSGQLSHLAIAIKPEDELRYEKVLARLEIERLWWAALGVPWHLVTDAQIDKQLAKNIKWFSDPLRGRKSLSMGENKDFLIEEIVKILEPGVYQWDGVVEQLACELDCNPRRMASVIKAAIWQHRISVDMTTPIQEQRLIHVLDTESKTQEGVNYESVSS